MVVLKNSCSNPRHVFSVLFDLCAARLMKVEMEIHSSVKNSKNHVFESHGTSRSIKRKKDYEEKKILKK